MRTASLPAEKRPDDGPSGEVGTGFQPPKARSGCGSPPTPGPILRSFALTNDDAGVGAWGRVSFRWISLSVPRSSGEMAVWGADILDHVT